MLRLFVALRPPRAIRESLIAAMGGVPHARWQDDEQLHCTLRFLGEVDPPQAEDVAAALGSIDIRLVYYRGLGECRASPWLSSSSG